MTESPADWTRGGAGIVVQSCNACGLRWYLQRPFCPRCGSTATALTASSCRGTVHASTRVDRAPSPEWRQHAPYGLALVDLDEGVRAMMHADLALRIGDRVQVVFRAAPSGIIPYAEAADPSADEGSSP